MLTRRKAIGVLGVSAATLLLSVKNGTIWPTASAQAGSDAQTPPLAPGAPQSPERMALIEAFKKQSEGLDRKFEARTHKSDWVMPYRLFRPEAKGKVPLVLYLHGSGGLGDDNLKQLGLGNIFGTRVWLLPENQKRFPCYVVAPQTDRGWIRYDFSNPTEERPKELPGFGDGARLAHEIVEGLCDEFSIDERRIYVTGQSMGGAGTWNLITFRPKTFAAALICCGSGSHDDGTGAIDIPVWNFHGESDNAVPVSVSRDRIAARRKAGGRIMSTEYTGVDHNVWEWAYTEPALAKWIFSQQRAG